MSADIGAEDGSGAASAGGARQPPAQRTKGGASSRRRPLESLYAWLARFPTSLFQLMFRIAVGGVFWDSGQTKIASWQTTIVLFRDEYRVPLLSPQLAATLATSIELVCPVLLVVGLATRIATLPMLGMVFVIEAFVYPEDWLQHLSWAAMLLFILTRGPGTLSLDHLILRASKLRQPSAPPASRSTES